MEHEAESAGVAGGGACNRTSLLRPLCDTMSLKTGSRVSKELGPGGKNLEYRSSVAF